MDQVFAVWQVKQPKIVTEPIKKSAVNTRPFLPDKSSAPTAGFAIPRAFFTRRTRCGIHRARIIPFCFAAAIGANDLVGVNAH